jgi:hypothetical protein
MVTSTTDEIIGRRAERRAPLALRVTEAIAQRIAGKRPSRRSFLTTTAVAGSAVAVAPWRWILQPVSAYEAVCGPAAECGYGWTVFCCTINEGRNSCPPGSVAAGWWKADQNSFCGGGARYYVDCNSTCGSCGCDSSGICGPECWSCGCRCNDDPNTCDHRRVCCNRFRYGNCNMDIACVGPVVCRIVSCVPPWEWEPGCTTVSATSNQTGAHHAPCVTETSEAVFAFGTADDLGEGRGRLGASTAGISPRPDGTGFWVASTNGGVRAFGRARHFGALDANPPVHPIVDIQSTPSGRGYWLVNSNGRVWAFGDAVHHGSTTHMKLVKKIVAMTVTPTGDGYWLMNSNGRVFAFGDAVRMNDADRLDIPERMVAIAATPSGRGYWIASARGGVWAFGDATRHGHAHDVVLDSPIVDMVAMPDGRGYLLLAANGRVRTYGSARHRGGLPTLGEPYGPAAGLAMTEHGGGYWIATTPR